MKTTGNTVYFRGLALLLATPFIYAIAIKVSDLIPQLWKDIIVSGLLTLALLVMLILAFFSLFE